MPTVHKFWIFILSVSTGLLDLLDWLVSVAERLNLPANILM